jgi:hypothetical protein
MIAHLTSPWIKYKVKYVDHHRHGELGVMVHREVIINAHGPIHAETILGHYIILSAKEYNDDEDK